jgi:hypothetical protein
MADDKEELLKVMLLKFFTKKRLISVYEIIENKNPISIRKIEWFISTYCKNNDIEYNKINIYDSYKNEQLRSYSKQYFDFFRRKKTFQLIIDKNRTLNTTVAQLNFFKWMIKNNLIDFVKSYDIENLMKSYKQNRDCFEGISIVKNKIIISFN